VLLYLDQNYLSGIAKRKPAFRELEPVLRDAVRRGAVQVPESPVHRIESAARPDLGLLELLRELSGGLDGAQRAHEQSRNQQSPLAGSHNGRYRVLSRRFGLPAYSVRRSPGTSRLGSSGVRPGA
jgi:hypothetical protein